MVVVEKGYVFMVCGATTWLMVPMAGVLKDAALQEVGEREVVVGGKARTGPTAVLKQHCLVRVIAQPEVSYLQQDGVQSTWGLSAAGQPNRPFQLPLWTLLGLTITSSKFFITEVRV